MVVLNVAEDFSIITGARHYSDGPKSGQEFYEKLLKKAYEESVEKKEDLIVELDGTTGYTSSFPSEAFGRLYYDFGETIWERLKIISNDNPLLIDMIKETITEYSQSKKLEENEGNI